MTTQLLATELANLIQESKRKHNDLRQAAEKSLDDLRNLRNTSEQGAPEELATKVNFVNPFIIACGTKNAKFTAIAIVCLQRLIVARALPRSRLNQVLEALMQASSAGALDVQLKILQALPSLLQNYSSDLKGDLLVNALNICFTLQSSKNAIVNNTSAATLQQLVVSVFDKVVVEDKSGKDTSPAGVAPTSDGEVELGAAALDAYRIFNDLCLLTENQRPEFLRFQGLPQTFGLELIESVITNHASVFTSHPEQVYVLRNRAMPLITSALKGRPSFATTVRLVRILYTMLRRHINVLPEECGEALGILTALLDQDATLWKRALCMEVFRGIFAEHSLLRRIYALYDAREGERDVLKNLCATFVRLSTEKPAVIGLGHQSSVPAAAPQEPAQDQAVLEASGITGIISSGTTSEGPQVGISTKWSTIRVPCIDQLDKTEPPAVPESYTYSLILSCISSLSDGLAKFVLPLTVTNEARNRRKLAKHEDDVDSPAADAESGERLERAASFKKNPLPVNPLTQEDHPMHSEVKICAALVDECWPAILATCSTFLYAAMDSEYYHGLVRAFQRFAHVAGLLQLATPRDAFLTTLGKAAVPPNVFTACLTAGQRPGTGSAGDGSSSILSNARGLLSTDNLSTPTAEKRQPSFDAQMAMLNTRNLLCLRALLNLGIALGPTLSSAWRIVLETLQQADFVLFSSAKTPGRTPSIYRGHVNSGEQEGGSLTANFGNEVRAVETAASRLMESTVDFPNESFLQVVQAIRRLLQRSATDKPDTKRQPSSQANEKMPALQAPGQHRRVSSFSTASSGPPTQEDQFALVKLGEVASINIERLLAYPPDESGWTLIVEGLVENLNSKIDATSVRTRAAETLAKLMLETANLTESLPEEARGPVQLRMLQALSSAVEPLQEEDREVSVAVRAVDVNIHRIILDGLKSIVEECGESLVRGWEVAFDIIGSVFILKETAGDERAATDPTLIKTRSPKLVRASFSSLQLIASDFLASLPNSCFLILVDTLYKFSSQDDDLNIALTTVTFFWVLSDFLSSKSESLKITAELMEESEASDLTKKASDHSHKASVPALWMLLLLRLTAVASDDRLELRNSAIQTLLRIFDAYGDRLSPEAWLICVKSVVFRLLIALQVELEAAQQGATDGSELSDWTGTAVVVLDGISALLADYLEVLLQSPGFGKLWNDLFDHLASMLEFEILDIDTATYKALSRILSRANSKGGPTLSPENIERAWGTWSRSVPNSSLSSSTPTSFNNQACLSAYVSALRQVYALIQNQLSASKVEQILELLNTTVERATMSNYSSDIEQTTQLQSEVLDAINMIRTDVPGVPSAVIEQLAVFVTLAFSDEQTNAGPGPRCTFVALSKASMAMMETLVIQHAADPDLGIYTSGALATALSALREPVTLKYQFGIKTKLEQPWRLATKTALSILEPTLSQLSKIDIAKTNSDEIWTEIARLAAGIIQVEPSVLENEPSLADDEVFDIEAFHKLRALIVPLLGTSSVSEDVRKDYALSLFMASTIHHTLPAQDSFDQLTSGNDCMSSLYTIPPGRTVSTKSHPRANIAFVALDEMFSLVSVSDTTGPTAELESRIACTVAPYLLVRCGNTLRAFIADQPLRGRMPQPLSEKKELVWLLKKLVALHSRVDAIQPLENADSDYRKHLLRLYPLIVKSIGVNPDDEVSRLLREALDVIGGELGL
ncbi:uncharacterized protein F5Z01DRAFT_492523 [Emericellopsis atlantica]|uniref:Endosomal peripheral membrane protein n=1 Tax=Emericellopsis atlantica TaxID=2614577 RepID=A0A9P7ZS95_9HYPO|nr:uncharacterized protein F5Z01DRAFT_492523 [Emericellopsis atlantica]KAG9256912.1 hypothetical protein F5Z01DRAFT_492523 [Emericellopsis atlantica]